MAPSDQAGRPAAPRHVPRRKILFCTIGQTPQVVTETVWALRHQTPRAWMPDEIHVVTTTFALDRVRFALQHGDGQLAALFDGPAPPVTIHVPRRTGDALVLGPAAPAGAGTAAESVVTVIPPSAPDPECLSDVDSEQDAATMGDLILRLIAGFVHDESTEVHVSLAGGRKTMSAHALLAMTLIARPRDKASHVLVSPRDFEDHPGFWHPDQGGTIPQKRRRDVPFDGAEAPLDPKQATVRLVPTPTPLMRYEVKDEPSLRSLRLTDVIDQINVASTLEEHPQLHLDTATNTVTVANVPVTLGAKLFAFYRLIATARHESWPGVGSGGTGPEHAGWLSYPHICFGRSASGHHIDQLFLRFLIEAVAASPTDNDSQDNKSINSWKAVLAVAKGRGRKLEMVEKQLRPNLTNLRTVFRRRYGASATRVLLPPSHEGGALAPLPGAPADSELASRFGTMIPPEPIVIV